MAHANVRRRVFFRSARVGMFVLPLAIFTAMFEFALPLKIESIEPNLTLVGIFISLSWLATTFLDLLFGDLTDRIGKKRAIIIGIATFALFAAGFAFTNNFWVLFLLNLVAYIGFDLFFIAVQGYVLSTNPKKYFNYASSGFYPLWSFGFVLGPLISAYLIMNIHSSWVYLLAPAFGALTIVLINLLREKTPVSMVPHEMPQLASGKNVLDFLKYFRSLLDENFWLLGGIMICTFWYSAMLVGIPLLFLVEEGNIWLSAFVMVAFMMPFVITDSLTGFVARNRHRRVALVLCGFVLGGLSLVAFYFTENFVLLAILAGLSTLGMDSAWTVFDIEAGLHARKGEEGRIESVFMFAKNIGWDLSPMVFGFLAQHWGIRMPFLVFGGAMVLAAMAFVSNRQVK